MYQNEDKALKAEKLFDAIDGKIEQLENHGLNMINYRKQANKIRVDLQNALKEYEDKNVGTNRLIFLNETYTNTVTALERILGEIDVNYSEYMDIADETRYLNNILESVEQVDTREVFKRAGKLLDSILNSSTVKYEEEEKIIEAVYEVVYNIMKLEAIYNDGDDFLFFKVSQNFTHSGFIAKLVEEEIANSGNKQLKDKKIELETRGNDSSVLIDKELFSLLAKLPNNNYVKRLKKKLQEMLTECQNKLLELENQADNVKSDKKNFLDYSEARNHALKEILIRCSVLLGGLALTGFLSFKAFCAIRDSLRTFHYTLDTYDIQTGEIVHDNGEEQKGNEEPSVRVVEEGFWEKKGIFSNESGTYTKTYKLEFDKEAKPQDYLERIDGMEPESSNYEKNKEKSSDFNLDEKKYSVIVKEYGEVSKEGNIFLSVGLSFAIFTLSILLEYFFLYLNIFCYSMFDDDECVSDFKKNSHEMKLRKDDMIRDTKRLAELYREAKQMLETLKSHPYYSLIGEQLNEAIEDTKESEGIQRVLKAYPEMGKLFEQ